MPLDTDIFECRGEVLSLAQPHRNAFIEDPGVALGSAKSVAELVGGIQDVIQQPGLTKIIVARKMKSEKIVLQFLRDQIEKFDLAVHRQKNLVVFDLLAGEAR